jgi:hypothetical protein
MKRLLALCLLTLSQAAAPQSIQRTSVPYLIDCGLKVPCGASLEIYDPLNAQPYWTANVDVMQMPVTQTIASGGAAVVYLRVTCNSADGTVATLSAIYRFHYPDAPLVIGPSSPTGITVTSV